MIREMGRCRRTLLEAEQPGSDPILSRRSFVSTGTALAVTDTSQADRKPLSCNEIRHPRYVASG